MSRQTRSKCKSRTYSSVSHLPEGSQEPAHELKGQRTTPGVVNAHASALLRRVAAADRCALGELYDLFAPTVHAFALRALGSARDAEDLVHDLFLEIWKHAREYDESRGSVRRWFLLRARSRAVDRLRRLRRAGNAAQRAAEQRVLLASASDPDLLRDAEWLRGTLQALPEGQRAVVELSYFAGYSSAEIASELAIPIGTVKSRMARAIAQLRIRMRDPCGAGA